MQVVMARYFGAGVEVDAYVAALAAPTVLSAILSSSLGYVLVPVIAQAVRQHDERAAHSVVTQIGAALTTLALLLTALMAAFSKPLAVMLCPGFSPAEIALTAGLLRVLSLLLVTNCLVAFLNALYHAFQRFATPAVAGVVGTGATLVYLLMFHRQQGIDAIAWGTVWGSLIAVLLMSPLLARQFKCALAISWPLHPATRRCLYLLVPLILGAIYWRLDPLLDRFLASYLAAGNIAHLGYSWRLVSGLMLIGTSGLSIVAFPAIAAHAAARRLPELHAELAHAFRFFLFLMIPIAIGASTFAVPVVRLLFEHGRFTSADSQSVALLVVLYSGVILGAGLGDLLSRTSYAQQDMRTPVLVSILAFTVAAILKVVAVRFFGAAGIVAATSFYSAFNVLLLGTILVNRLSSAILQGTAGTTLRATIASAVASAAAAPLALLAAPWAVVPAAALGALTYLGAMLVFRDEFALQFARWFTRRSTTG